MCRRGIELSQDFDDRRGMHSAPILWLPLAIGIVKLIHELRCLTSGQYHHEQP